jgi:hypothetical protein
MSADDEGRFDGEAAEAREIEYIHRCQLRDMRDGIPEWMRSGEDSEDSETSEEWEEDS